MSEAVAAPSYREVQRFRQWWLILVVISTASIGWVAFVQQIVRGVPFGSDPASDLLVIGLFALVGVFLPVVFVVLRLVTDVTPERIEVGFWPFPSRRIDPTEILAVKPVTYRAVAEWGGFGYRRKLDGSVAFIVAGDTGVELALPGERRILIGSQHPGDLANAVTQARTHPTP